MKHLKGSITALITPFKNGQIDDFTYQSMVERQIDSGSHGLVPAGTTGESVTLNDEEHERVIRLCVEAASGRVPVIAGAGSNNTAYGIALAQLCQKVGADAILAVTGYYNRPNQNGLLAHFTALHDEADLPIIIYNIPARTVVGLTVETLAQLSQLPRIVGIKDATGDLARVAMQRRSCSEGFIQLSGEDMTAVGFNAMGGHGCISVVSNVAPKLCAQMQNASLEDDFVTARKIQDRLVPLIDALFSDASPAPTKYALSLMGQCRPEVRLPLVEASESSKIKVHAAMEELGLLN